MSRPGGASSAGKHDPPPKLRAAFSGGLPTAKQRAALAGGKTVILKTTINQPGKVTILVKARVGGKKTAILSASKTATKAGIVSMSMKLSSAGLRALRSARSLRVTFSARVTGVAAARTNTATLRAPKPSTSTPR
jgi:hypothetical protein